MEGLLTTEARRSTPDRDVLIAQLSDHGPILLAAARVVTLDDEEARDIVQTTFEIALRQIGSLRDPTSLRSWLLRIEMREAFRVVRRLRRRRSREHAAALASEPDADAGVSLQVRAALETLPRRTRAAVVLHHLVGLSVRETAAALGVSDNTIKTQLKAGLERLRKEMS